MADKFEIPTELVTTRYCELCKNGIYSQDDGVKIKVYIGHHEISTLCVCDICTRKRLNVSIGKINFTRALVKFRKYNGIRNKDFESWNKQGVEVFIDYLKSINIKINDYGVIICRKSGDWENGYSLMELIKHYNIEVNK